MSGASRVPFSAPSWRGIGSPIRYAVAVEVIRVPRVHRRARQREAAAGKSPGPSQSDRTHPLEGVRSMWRGARAFGRPASTSSRRPTSRRSRRSANRRATSMAFPPGTPGRLAPSFRGIRCQETGTCRRAPRLYRSELGDLPQLQRGHLRGGRLTAQARAGGGGGTLRHDLHRVRRRRGPPCRARMAQPSKWPVASRERSFT